MNKVRSKQTTLTLLDLKVVDVVFALIIVLCVTWPTRLMIGPLRSTTVIPFSFILFLICGYRIHVSELFKRWPAVLAAVVIIGIYFYYGDPQRRFAYFLPKLLIIIMGLSFASNQRRFLLLLDTLIGVFAVLGLLGLVEAVAHFNVFDAISGSWVEYYGANSIRFGLARSRGISSLAINYCFYYLFTLGIGIYRIATSRRKHYPFFCYICMWIGALCTISRGPLVLIIIIQIILAIRAGLIRNVNRVLGIIALILLFLLFSYAVFPDSLGKNMTHFFYMMLSMFDAKYANQLNDINIGGAGQRLELFSWVASWMPGHEFLGWGPDMNFTYQMSTGVLKESLENAYLSRWFHTGFVGLGASLLFFISIAIHLIKRCFRKAAFEINLGSTLSYSFAFALCYTAYLVCGFEADFGDELTLLYLLLGVYLAYECFPAGAMKQCTTPRKTNGRFALAPSDNLSKMHTI